MTGLLFVTPPIMRGGTVFLPFTSVTVHEIVYGLELKGASAQLQKALLWLNQNEQITPTAAADYLQAATIKAAARKARLDCRTP